MIVEYNAIAFETADEAIQHMYADGRGEAVLLRGTYLNVAKADCDRLAAAGVEFAYLHDHEMPDGSHRIVTIPVN
jgi:hypothetical protein